MFSVLNLQVPLDVFVNGEGPIGTMDANPDAPGWNWQVLCMSGGRLKGGDGLNNEISVALPPASPAVEATFMIRNPHLLLPSGLRLNRHYDEWRRPRLDTVRNRTSDRAESEQTTCPAAVCRESYMSLIIGHAPRFGAYNRE
jgi:hypothetical protein